MTGESSIHFRPNWAPERPDEMDAAVASLEPDAARAKAVLEDVADRLIADSSEATVRLKPPSRHSLRRQTPLGERHRQEPDDNLVMQW